MGYKPIRLDGRPVRITIIQVCLHQHQQQVRKMWKTYGRRQDLIRHRTKRGDEFVIMGDWNVKMGDTPVEGISVTH